MGKHDKTKLIGDGDFATSRALGLGYKQSFTGPAYSDGFQDTVIFCKMGDKYVIHGTVNRKNFKESFSTRIECISRLRKILFVVNRSSERMSKARLNEIVKRSKKAREIREKKKTSKKVAKPPANSLENSLDSLLIQRDFG